MNKRILITGASRGLGMQVARYIPVIWTSGESITLIARNSEKLKAVAQLVLNPPAPWDKINFTPEVNFATIDLTNDSQVEKLSAEIADYDTVIYCAGGGPFGEFKSKKWEDHHWALKLNLLTPAHLIRNWLQRPENEPGSFVVVGSRIAEQNPDPMASSYSAAKHGLVGLISSLQEELKSNKNKVLLFSPGYLDTDMLPPNAKVRKQGVRINSPEMAAQALLRWVNQQEPWHRVLS